METLKQPQVLAEPDKPDRLDDLTKLAKLYEGKAKALYATSDPDLAVVSYRDDATAFDGKKRGTIAGKGRVCAQMSARLFSLLESRGIATHFVRLLGANEMLVRRLTILPIEVVVRNRVAGSLAKRTGLAEGTELDAPVLELYYKNDALGDPMINEDHVRAMRLADPDELEAVKSTALEVNRVLREALADRGIELVDFKLEFGRTRDGRMLLADEVSPDTCRLWDARTRDRLDKDRFRRDMGGVEEAYEAVLRRLEGLGNIGGAGDACLQG